MFGIVTIDVTPPANAPDFMKERIDQFWSAMGGEITIMTPQEHDKIFSTVSHLPHILAFNLVNLINNKKLPLDDIFDETLGVLRVVNCKIGGEANSICIEAKDFRENRMESPHCNIFGFMHPCDIANSLRHFLCCLVCKR